jgi:hydrogenase nickel incorporation protein HypA/HybF
MHELAITESVVAQVGEKLPDAKVAAVTLEIGRLSGVVADSVRFCFDLCTPGTPLEGARLEIIDIPGRGRCRTCTSELDVADLLPECGCGSFDIEILGGEELRIRQVEVV